MRTQVAIIGAGPAGLVLAHLLRLLGVSSCVLEARSREHIEGRVRAGVLEQSTVDLLRAAGVAERLDREGMPHHGFALRFDRTDHRIALTELTGRSITVYGQQEVVKDLVASALGAGQAIHFGVGDVALHGLTTTAPHVTYRGSDGTERVLHCEVVAGCDGSHGVSRRYVPDGALRVYQHDYPYAWLGILARTPPSHPELVYAYHERGFALHSMRSPELTRLYLQVPPETRLEDWSEQRIWDELGARLDADGFTLTAGPLVESSIATMRSVVVEPMRYGRLFLAGDAAHIVPATGAKGMNLAIADARALALAVGAYVEHGRTDLLDGYSDTCLRRVWSAEQFSWWMTTMLHRAPGTDAFTERLQRARLRHTVTSRAAAAALAESYVGLPYEGGVVWPA
jgi:p-hydroxybenzoate 3-monooxygenase